MIRSILSLSIVNLKEITRDSQWFFPIGVMPVIYGFSVLLTISPNNSYKKIVQVLIGTLGMGMWNVTVILSSTLLRKDKNYGLLSPIFRSTFSLPIIIFLRSWMYTLLGIVPLLIITICLYIMYPSSIVLILKLLTNFNNFFFLMFSVLCLSICMALTGTLLALNYMLFESFDAISSVISRVGLILGGIFISSLPYWNNFQIGFLPFWGMTLIKNKKISYIFLCKCVGISLIYIILIILLFKVLEKKINRGLR